MTRDDDLRRRQAREERERDRCWDREHSFAMIVFEQAEAEIALAEKLLRDGQHADDIVPVLNSMRHSCDRLMPMTGSDDALSQSAVEIARLRLNGEFWRGSDG